LGAGARAFRKYKPQPEGPNTKKGKKVKPGGRWRGKAEGHSKANTKGESWHRGAGG